MAKVRIGIATAFELENELVGIGTDNPTNTLQALGNIQSSDVKAIGVSTFKTYQGFLDPKAAISGFEGAKSGSISDEIVIEGTVTVSSGATVTSGPEDLTVTKNFTLPGVSDEKPIAGTTRFNDNSGSLEFYTGYEWTRVNSFADMGNRGRGLFWGVYTSPYRVGDIDYIEMASLGNAKEFGDLDTVDFYGAATSNSIRGVMLGGWTHPADTGSNIIQYVTIASTGDAINFGDLTEAVGYMQAACGSSTRSVRCGGAPNPSPTGAVNTMDYVEIMTTGNAIDFGDLYIGVRGTAGCSSATRGLVFVGTGPGTNNASRNEIQQFTIASKGNSINFGILSQKDSYIAAASNSVRGVRMGGAETSPTYTKTIDYVTIASEGNASYFGDLTIATGQSGGTASQIRGFNCGGCTGHPVYINTIDYVTLATAGNATDFGDSIQPRAYNTGCSDSHGGLGGF